MAPKRKRRRRVAVADSGLGVSLRENDADVTQKETCIPDANILRESELGGNNEQIAQAENSSLTKEKSPLETGQGSLGENNCPEIAGDLPEETAESPRETGQGSLGENDCPEIPGDFPEERAESPRETGQGSLGENDCPEIAGDFPEERAESPREINVSSLETVSPPNKAKQQLETEVEVLYINDSDSDKSMRELLQTVNSRSQVSDKGTESDFPVCTACSEGSGNSHTDSSGTEDFARISRASRRSKTFQVSHNDEIFSLSKICASQKTGQSVTEDGGIEEVTIPNKHNILTLGDSFTHDSHSCPADIGRQRQILVCDKQSLANPVLPSFAKKLLSRNKITLQRQHPHVPEFHFSPATSVISESPEFVEHQNRGRQYERSQASTQSLSVWTEAQSEYFPRGKPSDLGELLEVATRYGIKAWLKGINPPITGLPTNLVIKFCGDCHRKYCFDETESNHLCSKSMGGSQKPLKLIFYVELELCDETHETLKVALTGDQATKLFCCKPLEFLRHEEFQKRVWDSFKRLLKGGNKQNLSLKDAVYFSLEPHLKRRKMNYRVLDIRPFICRPRREK